MTPWKTVDRKLATMDVTVEEVLDERWMDHPVFIYFGTNGWCRDDGAHAVTGETAREVLDQLDTVERCDCNECTA